MQWSGNSRSWGSGCAWGRSRPLSSIDLTLLRVGLRSRTASAAGGFQIHRRTFGSGSRGRGPRGSPALDGVWSEVSARRRRGCWRRSTHPTGSGAAATTLRAPDGISACVRRSSYVRRVDTSEHGSIRGRLGRRLPRSWPSPLDFTRKTKGPRITACSPARLTGRH